MQQKTRFYNTRCPRLIYRLVKEVRAWLMSTLQSPLTAVVIMTVAKCGDNKTSVHSRKVLIACFVVVTMTTGSSFFKTCNMESEKLSTCRRGQTVCFVWRSCRCHSTKMQIYIYFASRRGHDAPFLPGLCASKYINMLRSFPFGCFFFTIGSLLRGFYFENPPDSQCRFCTGCRQRPCCILARWNSTFKHLDVVK